MKCRCPACGATLSLETLLTHEAARKVVLSAFSISGELGMSMIRYLSLHRPATRELSMDRVAKLLDELLPDVRAQQISRGGQVFAAPVAAWVWAVEQAVIARDAGRLSTPLKGHGWLYEVISRWQAPEQQGGVVAASEPRQGMAKPQSKTLAAIAALEDRARGRG